MSNDKRYIRTHSEIRRVFEEMILEKHFDEISISELARRANINRKTFYLHYHSIFDALEELQEGIVAELSELNICYSFPADQASCKELVKGFIKILSRNLPLHRRLFSSGGYQFVFDRIRSTMAVRYADTVREQEPEDRVQKQLLIDFTIYGFLFVCRDWLLSEHPVSAEDLTLFTSKMIYSAAEAFFIDD